MRHGCFFLRSSKKIFKAYITEELTKYGQILEDAYESAQKVTCVRNRDWLDSPWDDFFRGKDPQRLLPTGIDRANIEQFVEKFSSVPEGFNLHRGLERTLKGMFPISVVQGVPKNRHLVIFWRK
jgi:2-oxoglutarate dehydrogenase complex dehydrogenase (E1) component-like enzyme